MIPESPCYNCPDDTGEECRKTCKKPSEWSVENHDYKWISKEVPLLRDKEKIINKNIKVHKKVCPTCGRSKTLSCFYESNTENGLMHICKVCANFFQKQEFKKKAKFELDLSSRDNLKIFRTLYRRAYMRKISLQRIIIEILKVYVANLDK